MAKGMHKPKSLAKRIQSFETGQRSNNGQQYTKPGSNKK